MTWIKEDLWRTGFLVAAAVAVVLLVLLLLRRSSPKSEISLHPWQIIVLALWVLVVVFVGGGTYFISAMNICTTTTALTPQSSSTETTAVTHSRPGTEATALPPDSSTSKITDTPSSEVTTKECGGLSVPALALLLVPGLIVLLPSISSLDVAGLFKLSFREVKEKLEEQKEQVEKVASDVAQIKVTQQTLVSLGVNLNIINQVAGATVAEGAAEARSGKELRPL